MAEKGIKIVAQNKKAYHDYFIIEKYEAGIELFGTEVKSLRAGQVNLKDSFCKIYEGELYALGVHISPYEKGNIFNKDPMREKRLLMHKKEIMKLHGLVGREGYSLIPLSIYFKGSRAKMEIGMCKGKKLYDKRESDAKKDANRMMERTMKGKGDE
ncbi:MAG: SsrA-binding protein SmpB [Clostridia bacterium]|jgi:SsrA-binding protein|nr:SsrA-binding protein SmpB [Clostridia bacterium]